MPHWNPSLSPDAHRRLLAAYKSDVPQAQIAQRFGIQVKALREIWREAGLDPAARRRAVA